MADAAIHTPPAVFFVSVNGTNVTNALNDVLEKITITDAEGGEADTCDIELADPQLA